MHERWFDQYEVPVQTNQPVIKREIPIEIPLQRRNLLLCSACHEQCLISVVSLSVVSSEWSHWRGLLREVSLAWSRSRGLIDVVSLAWSR